MPSKLHLLGILPFMGKSLLFPIYGSQKRTAETGSLFIFDITCKILRPFQRIQERTGSCEQPCP